MGQCIPEVNTEKNNFRQICNLLEANACVKASQHIQYMYILFFLVNYASSSQAIAVTAELQASSFICIFSP